MKNKPLVSVVMSVFNGEDFLKEAVDSILYQTYSNFEFIIINDCSKDRSLDILHEYNDYRIRIISNEKNLGLPSSLNKGFKLCTGKYIVRMDSDDISLPYRLEKQVMLMENDESVDFSGSQAYFIEGRVKTRKIFSIPIQESKIKGKLLWNSAFIHPSVILRRSSIVNVSGPYNPDFLNSQDYELWERLVFEFKLNVKNIEEPLLYYRVHPNSISVDSKNRQKNYARMVRKRTLNRFNVDGVSNWHAYNSYIELDDLSWFTCIRLSLMLNKMHKSNSNTQIVSEWNFKQLPTYKYGFKAYVVHRRTLMHKIFPRKKVFSFFSKSLFYSLTGIKK